MKPEVCPVCFERRVFRKVCSQCGWHLGQLLKPKDETDENEPLWALILLIAFIVAIGVIACKYD